MRDTVCPLSRVQVLRTDGGAHEHDPLDYRFGTPGYFTVLGHQGYVTVLGHEGYFTALEHQRCRYVFSPNPGCFNVLGHQGALICFWNTFQI